ncbi:hypothetical protein ACJJTC_002183 [Scirpophaga incertulas]
MYDKSSRPLQQIYPGDKAVLVCPKDNRKHVKIVAQAAQPRSYIVEDEFGNKFRRTRSHLVVRNTSKIGTRQQTSAPLAQVCPLQKRIVMQVLCVLVMRAVGLAQWQMMVMNHHYSPPPPPNVPIERSRERTERMLLNLNKD